MMSDVVGLMVLSCVCFFLLLLLPPGLALLSWLTGRLQSSASTCCW
jgi:hypothetical protein